MKSLLVRFFRISVIAGIILCTGAMQRGLAFSLLGPYTDWQTTEIGYRLPGDVGGPMDMNEGYRWNVPVITYGFDPSFISYFGTNGMAAVEQAFAILNNLPAACMFSSNLAEFPTSSKAIHYFAGSLKLMDLKSTTLHYLLEQLGLADPVRSTWVLRARTVDNIGERSYTNYLVIQRNLDPISQLPTNSVNEVPYIYKIVEPFCPAINYYADAVEENPIPFLFCCTSVAGFNLYFGEFYCGLTRDDVGGLRYLYSGHPQVESLLPLTWGAGANAEYYFDRALRPGVEKLNFVRMETDLTDGQFSPLIVEYTDLFIWSGETYGQTLRRFISSPDILFSARDLGARDALGDFPLVDRPAGTTNWVSNASVSGMCGPGVIQPPVNLVFNTGLPGVTECAWGSFEGGTDFPIIYSQAGPRLAGSEFNFPDGSVRLTIEKIVPGSTNIIESSADLSNWTTLSTNVCSGTTWTFLDCKTNSIQMFYRVRSTR